MLLKKKLTVVVIAAALAGGAYMASSKLMPGAAPTTGLRDMLASLPQQAVATQGGVPEIEFGDPQALLPVVETGAAQGLHDAPVLALATGRGLPFRLGQNMAVIAPEDMRGAVGLTHGEVLRGLAINGAKNHIDLLRLAPGAATAMQTALAAAGYGREQRAGRQFLWRGEDFAADPAAEQRANPFGGAYGLAGRFAFAGDAVLWSNNWPAIEAALADGPTLADQPAVAAMTDALDRAGAGHGALVHAMLYFDPQGENGAAAAGLAKSFGIAEDIALTGVLVADLARDDQESGILVLAFAPGTDSGALADRVAEKWAWQAGHLQGGEAVETAAQDARIRSQSGPVPTITIMITGGYGADGALHNQMSDALFTLALV